MKLQEITELLERRASGDEVAGYQALVKVAAVWPEIIRRLRTTDEIDRLRSGIKEVIGLLDGDMPFMAQSAAQRLLDEQQMTEPK